MKDYKVSKMSNINELMKIIKIQEILNEEITKAETKEKTHSIIKIALGSSSINTSPCTLFQYSIT